MRLKLKLMHMGLAIVLVPLVLELVFLVSLAVLLYQVEIEVKNGEHSRSVICDVDALTGCLTAAGMKLFDIGVSRDTSKVSQFEDELAGADEQLKKLRALIQDQDQLEKLRELENYTRRLVVAFENARDAVIFDVQSNPKKRKFTALTRSKQSKLNWKEAFETVAAKSNELIDMELKRHPSSPAHVEETRDRVKIFIRFGFILNVLLAIGLAGFFAKRVAGRVSSIAENASRLTRQEELLPMISGGDEIADLDMAFHQMASALKEASRRERAVIDNATEVICSLTAGGLFTSANPATTTVWLRQPAELVGNHFASFVLGEDLPSTQRALQEIVSNTSTGQFENRIHKGDGTIGHMMWSVRWDNVQRVLFCVIHDITQRKELERMKSEFMSMVSHDVRTPLSSMKSILTLFSVEAYGKVDADGKARIATTERDVDRVLLLINNLLDLDKMEEGKFALDLDDTTSGAIIQPAIMAVDELMDRKEMTLEVVNSDCTFSADKDRLIQATVNLLTRLIDSAVHEAEITIEVTEADGFVRFSLTDPQSVIPDKERELIFSRFAQSGDGRSSSFHGSGLGMPIAKAIVESHGGEIGVVSEEGSGTTFWFTIPMMGAPPA